MCFGEQDRLQLGCGRCHMQLWECSNVRVHIGGWVCIPQCMQWLQCLTVGMHVTSGGVRVASRE
jgi:hypothetical protein